jgi:ketosteroid isomerase-like protein
MKRTIKIISIFAAAVVFAACGAPAGNTGTTNTTAANAGNSNSAKPAAAAPTKEALVALEKSGWEAWKNKDPKWFEENLSSKAVGFSPADGRQDKSAMVKGMAESKCEVKSFSFSDENMRMLGPDVAVLTFKGTQDATCDGKKAPAAVWSSSVYVREGDKWKSLVYIENPVTDPNAKPSPPAPVKPYAPKSADAKPDALTEALMAVEKNGWDAWVKRDAAGVESVMGKNFQYVSGKGVLDRAAAIKNWAEPKCEGLAYTFHDPASISLSPDVALITYHASVKGKCDGVALPGGFWVASFNQKEGDAWKNAFYTDVPG